MYKFLSNRELEERGLKERNSRDACHGVNFSLMPLSFSESITLDLD